MNEKRASNYCRVYTVTVVANTAYQIEAEYRQPNCIRNQYPINLHFCLAVFHLVKNHSTLNSHDFTSPDNVIVIFRYWTCFLTPLTNMRKVNAKTLTVAVRHICFYLVFHLRHKDKFYIFSSLRILVT